MGEKETYPRALWEDVEYLPGTVWSDRTAGTVTVLKGVMGGAKETGSVSLSCPDALTSFKGRRAAAEGGVPFSPSISLLSLLTLSPRVRQMRRELSVASRLWNK
ncbi:hypothetical protein E2C01_016310 [Portunus trituberculatus]|uniref:Uncharacterized protein n=1 Tax=Portunus trituberculatus TaxID=210409 RepID=A0A5B7DP36_PORTR|nr:hypothetical protein [Portunus trituberculatus]